MKLLGLNARLGLDKFVLDDKSHIYVDQRLCRTCEMRPCLIVCPAKVYSRPAEEVVVTFENCLECGTCQLACDTRGNRGLTWHYPSGGCGIAFRFG